MQFPLYKHVYGFVVKIMIHGLQKPLLSRIQINEQAYGHAPTHTWLFVILP